jgi:hypothetical protein
MLSLKQLQDDFENDAIQDIYWSMVEIIDEEYLHGTEDGKVTIEDILSSDPSIVKLIEEYVKKDLIPSIWFEFKEWTERIKHLKKDGRHTAKKDEDIRVEWICEQINTKSLIGIKICDDYLKMFNKCILYVEKKGSNREHFDIYIYLTDGTTHKCEEKGTNTYIEDIKTFEIPWENSVQRFNGPGNKFSVGIKYAKLWYDLVICDKEICKKYGIDEQLIPTKDEWMEKDAFKCGDPTSKYGITLKQNHRSLYGGSMNGKGKSTCDYREIVNSQFIFTEADKQILLKETQTILDNIMTEKECWLQTSGVINGGFSWKWYGKIESPQIIDITMSWNKGADIYFNFISDDTKYNFKSILRFGKGTGFSNIRFDIR